MKRLFTLSALFGVLFFSTTALGQAGFRIGVRGSNVQVQKTTVDGVSTTEITEDGQKYKITESPDAGIAVEIIKTYDRSNAEEIKETHPAIYRYIEKSPVGMGPTRIAVKVELTQIHQAADVDELKDKHPDAHAIYERFGKGVAGMRLEMRGFPAAPFRRLVPPIRIEPKPEEAPQKEEAPTPMAQPKVRQGVET